MGIKIETIQNRFEGGMINDIRNSIQARTGNTFIARPYLFSGHEKARIDLGATTVDGLHKVKVTFDQIK